MNVDDFVQHFAWHDLNENFKSLLIQITNKYRPSIQEIKDNLFLQARDILVYLNLKINYYLLLIKIVNWEKILLALPQKLVPRKSPLTRTETAPYVYIQISKILITLFFVVKDLKLLWIKLSKLNF